MFAQGRHHASSPSLRSQETCWLVSSNHVRQVYQLGGTSFSASSEEADVTLQRIVLLVIYGWRYSSAAAQEKWPLANVRLVVLHKSVLDFAVIGVTPCRNEVLVALRRSPCLEHRRQRSFPWSTCQREVTRRVHVHRAWETRNRAPGSSSNECPWVLTSGKPLVITMRVRRLCEDDLIFKFASEVVVTL